MQARTLADSAQWTKALQLLTALQRQQLCPDVVLVTSVLNACGRAAYVDRAILLFEDMRRWSIDPSPVSYAAVINACAKCSYWQMALSYFDSCSTLLGSLRPGDEAISFVTTATISACGRAGQWQLSLALLEEASDKNHSKSIFLHNAAISACGSVAWPCALHLHCCSERMVPDLVTYGAVMSCCRLTWRWALRLLGDLMMERIQADAVCFGAAISACETAAEWQHALNLLQQLLQAELLPNTVIFNALASACEKAARWLWNSMPKSRWCR